MHSEPNYSLPWQRKRQFSSTSSGFVISDRRILTNAHSVDHHTQVKTSTIMHSVMPCLSKVPAQGLQRSCGPHTPTQNMRCST